ncbi:cytochrome c biogenesis protein [Leptothrix discophora]|uniref:Cytochrome c biogenesis protein CcsA n=1 Tax=Leptothrix discophora TaxID=89 RepID=A0ABT9FXZ7_LEPDI|nr:cytochrome c biogenesis protein CcsA [Leptothrix discophora]MDP4299114.1 cytochrome c biogenesis protein CcsA [Leptothrix discophora]
MNEAVIATMPDQPWLHAALLLYAASALPAFWAVLARRRAGGSAHEPATRSSAWPKTVLLLAALAVTLHTVSLGLRWATLGHGPFTTMHEILSSNLWSLALVYGVSAAAIPVLRRLWLAVLPVLAVLAGWMLLADARPGHLPPTYETVLLYLHTLVGKLFLGLLLTALAWSAVPLLRTSAAGRRWTAALPEDRRCDAMAHRYAAFAFVFEGAMLTVGAVWAQDAWGRYWGWDPLETWAFLTWLSLAATLHARITFGPSPVRFGLCLVGVFVLAFLTFFGVPFVSTSPHQGAI